MATKIVKTLRLPGDSNDYQINAVTLEGMTAEELNTTLSILSDRLANKADKADIPRNYVSYVAVSNVNVAGNVTTVYKHQFSAVPTILVPTTEHQEVTPTKSVQTVVATQADYLSQVTVHPIPNDYVIPEGTVPDTITSNGEYNVKGYASVNVEIPEFDGDIEITEIN